MKHVRGGRVNRMHRHTQSKKVWETCREMSLYGAIRGCGFCSGRTDKPSLPCREGQESQSWTDSGYFHSAGLLVVQLHNLALYVPLVCISSWSLKQDLETKQLPAQRSKSNTKQLKKTSTRSHEGQSEERGRKESAQDWWEIPAMCSFSFSPLRLCLPFTTFF